MKKYFSLLLLFLSQFASAQNTVGLQFVDSDLSIGGYNLLFPEQQSTVFLINECGEIVHQWDDDEPLARPGAVAYLLDNGSLIKAKSESGAISSGGGGGIVEMVNWDNELLWRYEIEGQHHDFNVLPNGNVLLLVWEGYDLDSIVQMGFDTATNVQETLVFEKIIEVNPVTDSIVWEWKSTDHLIQDHDPTKMNYGNISQHPERININYQEFSFQKTDWMHANSIDYNASLDQVMISIRNFNEIWIIDHSTNTTEAAGTTAGNSGRGGDLIFRWGNPHAYKQGAIDDMKTIRQHDTQWIDDFVNPDYEFSGAITLFNNGLPTGNSLGQILVPIWDANTQAYLMMDSTFLPMDFSATFSHPNISENQSTSASSIQILDDGQVVMCVARQGRIFELTTDGTLAWEYVVPLRNGFPISQGSTLGLSENFTFQTQRYPDDYTAFDGRDLTPKGFIELDPNTGFCTLVGIENVDKAWIKLDVFPNPATDWLHIHTDLGEAYQWEIISLLGEVMYQFESNDIEIPIIDWPKGVYFLIEKEKGFAQKIIVN